MLLFRPPGRAVLARLALLALVAGCADRSSQPSARSDHNTAAPVQKGARVAGRVPIDEGTLSIVTLEPREATPPPPPTETAVMDQVALTFTPAFLVVRSGSPVVFRNSDSQIHNINVKLAVTKEQAFNVAVPMGGAYRYSFQADGYYTVRCDIHAAMAASIVSTSTPYTALTDTDGRFSIENVPAGAYRAVVFVGSRRMDRNIDVTSESMNLQLQEP